MNLAKYNNKFTRYGGKLVRFAEDQQEQQDTLMAIFSKDNSQVLDGRYLYRISEKLNELPLQQDQVYILEYTDSTGTLQRCEETAAYSTVTGITRVQFKTANGDGTILLSDDYNELATGSYDSSNLFRIYYFKNPVLSDIKLYWKN